MPVSIEILGEKAADLCVSPGFSIPQGRRASRLKKRRPRGTPCSSRAGTCRGVLPGRGEEIRRHTRPLVLEGRLVCAERGEGVLLSALESLNAVDPRRLAPASPATLPLPRRSDQTGVTGVCLGHRVFRRPWSFADGDTRSAAIETPGNPICDSVLFSRIGAAMDIRPL